MHAYFIDKLFMTSLIVFASGVALLYITSVNRRLLSSCAKLCDPRYISQSRPHGQYPKIIRYIVFLLMCLVVATVTRVTHRYCKVSEYVLFLTPNTFLYDYNYIPSSNT